MEAVLVLLVAAAVLIALPIYFLPSMVALFRGAEHGCAVFAINLLAGWTMIGWVAAMVLAFLSPNPAQRREEAARMQAMQSLSPPQPPSPPPSPETPDNHGNPPPAPPSPPPR